MTDANLHEVEVELVNRRVVAIDGGAATGKGRLIDELSQLLRAKGVPAIHLSTGSVYRAVTFAALEDARSRLRGVRKLSEAEVVNRAVVALRDMGPARLVALAYQRRIEVHGGLTWIDGGPASIDEVLKSPGVGNGISIVAAHLEVRRLVNRLARRQINEFDGFVLLDGRDTTYVVVPDAPLKLLLVVAPAIAAQRSPEQTKAEIVARNESDRRHTYGALRHPDDPGENVVVLPTDDHTPESVRDHVYKMMRVVFSELPPL